MHAAVLLFLFSLRELHPELEHQCLNGSCFRLYQLLALVFPGAEPWYDHTITLIGGGFYDQRAFNRAYSWGKLNYDNQNLRSFDQVGRWRVPCST